MFRKIIDFFEYDSTGYDKYGHDRQGFDREGFNKDGYDRQGFDGKGFNKDGYDRQGFDGKGFNKDGYDRQGFDEKGFDREGIHKETKTLYDLTGYDRQGFDREGFNKDGYDKEDFDKSGLNRENKTRIQSLREKVISILEVESFDNSLDFIELKGILENCTPIDRFQIFSKDKVYIFDLVEHKLLIPLECDENSTLGKEILHHRVPFVITLLNEHKAIVVYRY